MAILSTAAHNFGYIPLQGLRIENLSAAPGSPQPGTMYFDTSLGFARICLDSTGPIWLDLKTLTSSNISDFTTAVTAIVTATRLDQLATPTGDVSLNSHKITNLADPTSGTDAANQQWVTSFVSARVNGLDWKNSTRVMATTNVSVSSAPTTIDGVTLTAGDRVLLTGQTSAAENGIYDFASVGAALTRSSDANTNTLVTGGMTVFVNEGTTGHDTIWSLNTNDSITLGTTTLAFQQIGAGTSYSAATPVTLTGTTFGLTTVPVATGGTGGTDAATARTNLGTPQRGFAADVGALTAGVGLAVAHGLGTADVVAMLRVKSTGATVLADLTVDATNVTITSGFSFGSGTFRLVVIPVA